jgi:hypothetical protein
MISIGPQEPNCNKPKSDKSSAVRRAICERCASRLVELLTVLLGYSGRDVNVFVEAALDRLLT